MKRRDLVAILVGVTAAWPIAARAQKAMPVIGIIGSTSPGPVCTFCGCLPRGIG